MENTAFVIKHARHKKQSPCGCEATWFADRFVENLHNTDTLVMLKEAAYASAENWVDYEDLCVWWFADESILNVFAATEEDLPKMKAMGW
jgi:hypothetical protein